MERIKTFFRDARKRNITIGILVLFIAGFFIPVPKPHVSLPAEPLLQGGNTWLTNSLVTTVIVDFVIIVLAITASVGMKLVPNGFQNFVGWMIEGMYGLTESVAGRGEKARKFFPWVMTIFIFVIVSNYIGLLPGVGSIGVYHTVPAGEESHAAVVADSQVAMAESDLALEPAAAEEAEAEFVPLLRSPSADLNVTLALAFVSVFMTQVYGVQALGLKYFTKFFKNPAKDAMGAIVGFFELISEIAKLISFSFRLFGNIFAGEVVLAVMAFLVTFLLPVVFYGLELFVGFIQALVFMLLTLAFFSMATVSHDEH